MTTQDLREAAKRSNTLEGLRHARSQGDSNRLLVMFRMADGADIAQLYVKAVMDVAAVYEQRLVERLAQLGVEDA